MRERGDADGLLARWTGGVYRHRVAVVILWVALTVVSAAAVNGAFGDRLSDLLSNRFDLPGTESDEARQVLEGAFGRRDDSTYTLVVQAPGAQPPLELTEEVTAAASAALPRSQPAPAEPAGPGLAYATLATALEPTDAEAYVDDVRAAVAGVDAGDATVYVSGAVPINADLKPIFDEDLARGEAIAIPFAIVVLLFIFGTLVATAVPVLMALVTVPVTLGLVWLVAQRMDLSIYITNLVSLIGIAIAIDYTLLIVYRFREELARHEGVPEALAATMTTAGRAVVFSGLTVAIGLAMLVFMPLPFIQGMGIGGLLIPLVSVVVALTLLPALLGLVGRHVDRARVVPRRVLERRDDPEAGAWARLARTIMRRPLLVAVVTASLLLALAIPVRDLSLTPGSTEGLPEQTESVQGLLLLEDSIGPGALNPTIVVVDAGAEGAVVALDPQIRRLAGLLAADASIADVQAPTDGPGERAYLTDASGRYAQVIASGREEYGAEASQDFARRLRADLVPSIAWPGEARVLAGGAPPSGIDFIDTAYSTFPMLVAGVLVVTYVLLVRAFRSLLLPLKAVILNVLSILAAYGILVIAFEYGAGEWVGLTQFDQIEAWIPIFLFAMVFGLSMDYEVFLLVRMREIYDRTGDNERAVSEGLERTGRIVTAAAAIMVAAFLGFVLGSLLGLRQFGLGLAVAIALDATVVRALLVPALMALMGRWNWWLPPRVASLLRVEPGDVRPAD